ncbi:MAG: ABC transporter ATP-binding protein, partial [Candidatus Gracilibacteria bacterium]|nr:ABC transporter ATP-binding protein [Candidatus Gracilibacteria bacterium]
RRYIEKYNKAEQELWEHDGKNKAKILMENLIIRVFNKEKYELKKSNEILEKIPKFGIKVSIANTIFYDFLELLLRLLEIGVYAVIGAVIITQGDLEISYLIMLTTYVWFLWWPIDKAISSLNVINRSWEKYKKLQDFLGKENKIKNGKEDFQYNKGAIEFKNVGFSYNDTKEIFKNLDLKLLDGKKNALVGHSGGGKSTFTKVLLRIFDYHSGEIFIDKQELKTLNMDSFYKYIGYLPQEASVFDGTIRENLEYAFDGDVQNKDTLIWKALKDARIDDMIKGLEKGLETEVGEKGIKLSGGERQRLAIARIFLKNPEIIILDEPTSALDSISEAKITKSLNKLMNGRTSIIIAHRLQTVMHADKIIVFENGKVETQGTHDELMKNSVIYKKLVDLQNGKINEE